MQTPPENQQLAERVARIEGVLESLATKEDLARLEHRLTENFRESLQESLKEVRDEIRQLSEKQNRLKGFGEALKFGPPFAISILALVAVLLK